VCGLRLAYPLVGTDPLHLAPLVGIDMDTGQHYTALSHGSDSFPPMFRYVLASGDVMCPWHACMHLLQRDRIQIDIPDAMSPDQVIIDASTAAGVDLSERRNPWGIHMVDATRLPRVPGCTRCTA